MKKYFKIRDEVFSKRFGKGVVITTSSNRLGKDYPIEVKTDTGANLMFTEDGKTYPTNKEIDLYQLDKVTFQENEEIKDEYIPFTYEDRELLKGKWIGLKNNKVWEAEIVFINNHKIGVLVNSVTYISYEDLLKDYEFSNGELCGKKVE